MTAAFAIALAATATYYAGLVPGVPKTLPTFVRLVTVTAVLFATAATTWAVSFATG